jgi:hypothetical protein
MSQRPRITLIDNPIAVAGTTVAPEITETDREPSPQRPAKRQRAPAPKQAEPEPAAPQPETNPFAGMRKVQAPVRLFPPLWDRLEQLVRELRDEGHEVDKTALLNAVLHFDGPATTDDARDLVNRWRGLLARPPARRG